MCSVRVCFNHYCLFYWDTHFSLSQKAYWKRVWQIIACRILIWHFVFDDAFVFAHLIVFVSAESQSVPLIAGGESRWSESARDRLSCWVARAEQPAPLLVYLSLRNFDFSQLRFCVPFLLICVFSRGYTSIKMYHAKAKRAENPHLGACFCLWTLDFPIEFFPFYFPYSYHRTFPSLPSSLKSKQIVRLSHQSGAPRLHPHCLHRWNFRISPKKELLDECSMGEDVSQCSDS